MTTVLDIIQDVDRDPDYAPDFSVGYKCAAAIMKALDDAGYAIVPKEPTEAMCLAVPLSTLAGMDETAFVWKAMIQAVDGQSTSGGENG